MLRKTIAFEPTSCNPMIRDVTTRGSREAEAERYKNCPKGTLSTLSEAEINLGGSQLYEALPKNSSQRDG